MIETKFKDSTYGLIPHDWKECRFENVLQTFSSGATPYRGIPSNFQGTIRWITSGELNYNHIYDTLEHISEDALKNTHLRLHPQGTFLMAITGLEAAGTRGRCAFVGSPSATNQSCLAINSTDKMIVEYLFWFYCYWSNFLAFRYSQGSKQQSFTANIVRNLPIYLPPTLDEQQRIAEALSDVDALISSLGKMIEKKRNIKLATMQQLLTGKQRLPGFTEPWVNKKLEAIGSTYNGLSGKTANDFGRGCAKYVTFLNVLNNPIIDCKAFEDVNVGIHEKQNKVQKGDLLFNTSSETPEEVGICATLNEDVENLYLNSFCFGFRVNEGYSPVFLSYFFRGKPGRIFMTTLAQGSTRYNLSKENMLKSSIFIPSSQEEQTAIANILTDMDNEIAKLEIKKSKYEAIKQGMMQQLLTGKIRLV